MLEVRDEQHWILLTDRPLDTAASANFLRDESAGGIDLFLGTTRRWTGERETDTLEYEAYGRMAVEEMKRLAEQAFARWPLAKVVVHHRIGVVSTTDTSVIVGTSSPHRKDAFAATRFLIDTLKQDVPIWKRERFADGTTEWVEGSASDRKENGEG